MLDDDDEDKEEEITELNYQLHVLKGQLRQFLDLKDKIEKRLLLDVEVKIVGCTLE